MRDNTTKLFILKEARSLALVFNAMSFFFKKYRGAYLPWPRGSGGQRTPGSNLGGAPLLESSPAELARLGLQRHEFLAQP
jgi:hypothetical protein